MGAPAQPVASAATPPWIDAHSLGVSLGPALLRHCEGRLTHLEWFRSTWQHGGAATGFARWRDDDGADSDVLVKVPVSPLEHHWTTHLSAAAALPLHGSSHSP